MVHPRFHAYPDCLLQGQGEIRKSLRVRPLVSTCEWMRWMQTMDVVWFALFFFNAFIDLNPMAALMRSAGDRVVVRVKKMKWWGVCARVRSK